MQRYVQQWLTQRLALARAWAGTEDEPVPRARRHRRNRGGVHHSLFRGPFRHALPLPRPRRTRLASHRARMLPGRRQRAARDAERKPHHVRADLRRTARRADAVHRLWLDERPSVEWRRPAHGVADDVVMIDELQRYPTKIRCFRDGSCHLTGTDLDELHAFARDIGLRSEWFQNHPLAPHYDLTPARRAAAIERGAVFVTAKQQARERRLNRATR
jgi:hypothetical protein